MATEPRVSPLLYVVLLLAIVVGVVSAVLVGGSPAPPRPHAGELVVDLPAQVWGLLFLSPLLAGLIVLVSRRIVGKHMSLARRSVVLFLCAAMVAGVLVYAGALVHSSSSGSITLEGSTHGANNTTANSTGNGTSSSQKDSNLTGVGSAVTVSLPSWGMLVMVAVLSACVAVFALPGVVALLLGRRGGGGPGAGSQAADLAAARNAIAEAAMAIDRGDDPRATIVRLYLRLLYQFAPRLGEVDHLTAEEIRTHVLAQLRVRPDAAEALTRLFEEARYSTHLMGPDAAERCRVALTAVEADLARAPVAAS